jgi:transposase-like protein
MQGPSGVSACRLSKETGVSQQTLSRWLQEANSLPFVAKKKRKKWEKKWTVEDKARVVTEAAELSGEELGAYLRREGVHPSELETWRTALEDGAGDRTTKRRIGELERELRRKEKALAEAAALLVLKKKVESYLVDEDDDTHDSSGSKS